jgi:hypothetical protein
VEASLRRRLIYLGEVIWFTHSGRGRGYESQNLSTKRSAALKRFSRILVLAVTPFFITPGFAQKLVDPNSVAPEYREAAEKRRAEQIKQRGCAVKAHAEKVMPRERTSFLIQCLEMADKK